MQSEIPRTRYKKKKNQGKKHGEARVNKAYDNDNNSKMRVCP